MTRTEQNIQIACVNWFRMQFPNTIIFAIPNSAKRGVIEGAKMKQMGTLAGMPDLQILHTTPDYKGLFIEMKAPVGTLQPNQKAMHERLRSSGYRVEVCRSIEEFMKVCNSYLFGV